MLTGIPLVNGEDMQVLRYEHNQKYSAHNDYFPSEYLSHTDGMQRTATILLYLTDVEKGGETHFPFGHPLKDYIHRHGGDASKFSDCASSTSGPFSAAVIPKRGDALLFYSMDPSNQLVDPKSNHEGCPVLEGVKWSSTIWMHQGPFREVKETPKKACQDENESCASWAASGECEKNPLYMVSLSSFPFVPVRSFHFCFGMIHSDMISSFLCKILSSLVAQPVCCKLQHLPRLCT